MKIWILLKEKLKRLFKNLFKNKDSIIQKTDKGNYVIIVDRKDYIKKMNNILSDQKKSTIVNLKDDTLLNLAVNQQKHVGKVLKKNLLSLTV